MALIAIGTSRKRAARRVAVTMISCVAGSAAEAAAAGGAALTCADADCANNPATAPSASADGHLACVDDRLTGADGPLAAFDTHPACPVAFFIALSPSLFMVTESASAPRAEALIGTLD
ncbi:hypothetical protein [Aquabacterium sp.]|uniref:hypothetical protein n=1 Tax=Aquabacterium sp. TaxID=1872578 RepID=UPI002C4B9872|nr:hypothetical protein [Aquabacterium sp.]HSW06695.1 hypothetical protein [Aquabacterium sp.]